MPRRAKCRKVCCLPKVDLFVPTGEFNDNDAVILTIEEYETLRLIDKENFSQEECGKYMEIARTTVQQIYSDARLKVSTALVEGKPLCIQGGSYRLCDGAETYCKCGGCKKHREQRSKSMRIAVTYENGEIFQHFGHTEHFKIYEIDDNAIVNSTVVETNGSGHGALAGFLVSNGVNVLICGGIGGGAQMALAEAGIKLFGGVSGNADDAVKSYLADSLSYNPDVKCNHHDHEHGSEGHTCGSHGCGNGSCDNH